MPGFFVQYVALVFAHSTGKWLPGESESVHVLSN